MRGMSLWDARLIPLSIVECCRDNVFIFQANVLTNTFSGTSINFRIQIFDFEFMLRIKNVKVRRADALFHASNKSLTSRKC